MTTPNTWDADVSGGTLRVVELASQSSDGLPILAIHGITANHRSWEPLAGVLPHRRLIAPDLRGRGRSSEATGPSSLHQHALDLLTVLDAAHISRAVVVGHSMGGSVAIVLRHLAPERVAHLVLVDGGLPLSRLDGVSPEEAAGRLLGPALERLSMTFSDREAYTTFWQQHPAFKRNWSPAAARYADYDVAESPDGLRSSVVRASVEADFIDQAVGASLADATVALETAEFNFLRAPRGLMDEPPGLFPPDLMASHADRFPGMRWRDIEDVNHYTILLNERGAREVAAVIEVVA